MWPSYRGCILGGVKLSWVLKVHMPMGGMRLSQRECLPSGGGVAQIGRACPSKKGRDKLVVGVVTHL